MGISNLFGLLQSMGADPSQEIKVVGTKQPSVAADIPLDTVPDALPPPAKRRMLTDQQLVNRQGVGNLPEHKGLFGMKGTLRDVVGTLGDAFLVASGNKAMYAPRRQAERASDAMAEMVSSPVHAVQALLGAGEPEKAYELYKQFQAQGNKDAELEIQRGTAAATAGKNQGELFKEGSRLFGQYSGAIARNPKLASQLLPVLQKIKDQYQLGDEFAIPGAEDVAGFEGFQFGGTPVQTQVTEQGRNARFTEGEKGKMERVQVQQAGANARDNPPAAPPQPTIASVLAPLMAKEAKGGKLTPAEAAVLKKYGPGKKSRISVDDLSKSLPPGFKMK